MIAFLVYILTGNGAWLIQTSYLQSTEEIYVMEVGILFNEKTFRSGDDYDLKYDFDNAEYPELLEKYDADKTAGDGTEFEKALALMGAYAGYYKQFLLGGRKRDAAFNIGNKR